MGMAEGYLKRTLKQLKAEWIRPLRPYIKGTCTCRSMMTTRVVIPAMGMPRVNFFLNLPISTWRHKDATDQILPGLRWVLRPSGCTMSKTRVADRVIVTAFQITMQIWLHCESDGPGRVSRLGFISKDSSTCTMISSNVWDLASETLSQHHRITASFSLRRLGCLAKYLQTPPFNRRRRRMRRPPFASY